MAENNSEDLQAKKEELEGEISKLEYLLDDSYNQVKSDISSFDPRGFIRRKPLPTVVMAVFLGYFLAREDEEDKLPDTDVEAKKSNEHKLMSTIWYEVKRLAARKVIAKAGDYMESLFDEI